MPDGTEKVFGKAFLNLEDGSKLCLFLRQCSVRGFYFGPPLVSLADCPLAKVLFVSLWLCVFIIGEAEAECECVSPSIPKALLRTG